MNEELTRRFPGMKPVNGSPTLFTFNGFGLSMYGRRNMDHETGTYIATRYITLLFVPVFALGSYRVADAEGGGWYFLGKEEVSKLWQTLNIAAISLVLCIVGMIYWGAHTSSPDYKQRQALELVDNHETGKVMESMEALLKVHRIGGKQDAVVAKKLTELALEGITEGSFGETSAVLTTISQNYNAFTSMAGFADDLSAAGIERLGYAASAEHEQAHILAGRFIKLLGMMKHSSVAKYKELDQDYLENLAADPKADVKYAVQLAEYCEAAKDYKRCKQLLAPRAKELEGTEGARILGQILISEGKHEVAYPMVASYVLPKLETLKKASDRFDKATDASYNRTIKFLNDGKAPDTFYTRYDKVSKEEQGKMVNELAVKRMDKDSSYLSALNSLREAGAVVPVAMDFGVMQLRRAQAMTDTAAKNKLLKSAEKTFLSIQSVAGDDEDYQLSLGQVYFWMGRTADGEKLFQTAMKSSGDSARMLYSQGSIYRELGDDTKGMKMLKKAYAKTTKKEDRYDVARTIATMCDDAEEEIEWLKKCNQEDTSVKIGLSNSQGKLAYSNGDYAEAQKHFEKAHADYKQMSDSGATFNNHSLVLQYLYNITGKASYYKESVDLMAEAVKLMPNNAILLNNAASQAFTSSAIQMASEKFSPEFIKEMRDLSILRLLYKDAAERETIRSKYLAQDSSKRAFQFLSSLRVLSPKSDWVNSTGSSYYWMMGMEKEARSGFQKIMSFTWEPDADWKETQQNIIDGKEDKEFADSHQRAKKYDARVRKTITNNDEWLLYQCSRVNQQISAQSYGINVDLNALVKLTSQAAAKYPSSYTASIHRDALLARGLHTLAKKNAQVKKLMRSHSRFLTNQDLLLLLTSRDDKALNQAVLNHSDIVGFLKATHQAVMNFPKSVSLRDRHMCKLLGKTSRLPSTADSASYLATREALTQSSYQRYPRSVSATMGYYWNLKLSGKEAKAKEIYAAALKQGVALPPLK